MKYRISSELFLAVALSGCAANSSTTEPEALLEPNEPDSNDASVAPDRKTQSAPQDASEGGTIAPKDAKEGGSVVPPDGPHEGSDASDATAQPESPPSQSEIGDRCTVASDCPGDAQAMCISESKYGWPGGYCATTDCSDTSDCGLGADCYDVGGDSTMCLRTCNKDADCRTGYLCEDAAKACTPKCVGDEDCESGEICQSDGRCKSQPCTSTSCESGFVCSANGKCEPMLPDEPGPGPGPSCTQLPPRDCTGTAAYCGELIQFVPSSGAGYEDYPLNGETSSNQYRSWIRRDVSMLVKWAAAYVDCKSKGWSFGTKKPLALGDMSEKNGAIPGTSVGQPGHPAGTHTNGRDMDIGYFQINTPDNRLRPICDNMQGGQDQNHCVKPPHLLDVWRTALTLGAMFSSPNIRVIGVDGKVGPLVEKALTSLCASGWLSGASCDENNWALAYETTDKGQGWYYFHHHHFHISYSPPTNVRRTLIRGASTSHGAGVHRLLSAPVR